MAYLSECRSLAAAAYGCFEQPDWVTASDGCSRLIDSLPRFRLSAATYDPVHRAVTLIPALPTPVGHFSIEGPGSQGKTTLTDVNGVPIDSGSGGPTPNAELFAAIKPHGQWFGPAKAEEVARRTTASQTKRSGPSVSAAEVADIVIGTIISPFVHH
jgi:hypothetical protein